MAGQARRDTACELTLRRALHALGLRYQTNRRVLTALRRNADVVFARARVAVFVDGCFWHGCREHRGPVHKNGEWWRAKIERNARRDVDTNEKLIVAGWTVVRVWEHSDPHRAAKKIDRLVARGQAGTATPRLHVM